MGFDHTQPKREAGKPRRTGRKSRDDDSRSISAKDLAAAQTEPEKEPVKKTKSPRKQAPTVEKSHELPTGENDLGKECSQSSHNIPSQEGTKASLSPKQKKETQAHSDQAAEPKHFTHDFDLIDRIHEKYAHSSVGKLRKITKGMLDCDPAKPSLCALGKWKHYSPCKVCSEADMERPPQNPKHPARNLRNRPEV